MSGCNDFMTKLAVSSVSSQRCIPVAEVKGSFSLPTNGLGSVAVLAR